MFVRIGGGHNQAIVRYFIVPFQVLAYERSDESTFDVEREGGSVVDAVASVRCLVSALRVGAACLRFSVHDLDCCFAVTSKYELAGAVCLVNLPFCARLFE